MNEPWRQFASTACLVLLGGVVGVVTTACAVDLTDSIFTCRGETECSSTSGGEVVDTTWTSSSFEESTSSTPDIGTSTSSESTDAGAETEISTTSSSPPFCGNGIVDGEEACDDGNAIASDGCQECAKDSIMFVSSEIYQGFALDGLYGADQRCRSLAAKAGLDRFLTFKAWLSTPTMSVADRFIHSRGRYVLVNGLVVAQNWDALTSGMIENPIMVDEYSQSQDSAVWTGTLASGEPALGSEFCEDWADDSGLLKLAGTGFSTATDATWSFFEQGGGGSELRLYCVEQ